MGGAFDLFMGVGIMSYKRNIDLMDKSLYPVDSISAQKRNLKESVSRDISRIRQTNTEIIDFVTKEMSDTLGDNYGPQAN